MTNNNKGEVGNGRLSPRKQSQVSSQLIRSGAEKKETNSPGKDSESDLEHLKSRRVGRKDRPLKARLIFIGGLSDEERQDRLNRIAEVLFDSAIQELRGGEIDGSK